MLSCTTRIHIQITTDIPPPHTTNRAINIDAAFDIAYEKEVKQSDKKELSNFKDRIQLDNQGSKGIDKLLPHARLPWPGLLTPVLLLC